MRERVPWTDSGIRGTGYCEGRSEVEGHITPCKKHLQFLPFPCTAHVCPRSSLQGEGKALQGTALWSQRRLWSRQSRPSGEALGSKRWIPSDREALSVSVIDLPEDDNRGSVGRRGLYVKR